MPNWCSNELIVTGADSELSVFKQYAEGVAREEDICLDFNKFVPYIKGISDHSGFEKMSVAERELVVMLGRGDLDKDYDTVGYNWCIKHWGTKWNATHSEIHDEPGCLTYGFDTAWTEPAPVIHAMSRIFPELSFSLSYREEGEGFEGVHECKAGVVTLDRQSDIPEEEEEDED